jgi:PAS domain S-box-containing protein
MPEQYSSGERARIEAHSEAAPVRSLHSLSVDQVLESAPDAMLIVNHTGEIVYLNSLASKLFGYDRSELLGRSIEILVPPEARHTHETHRATYFQKPRVRMMETGLALFGQRKDESRFPIEISLSPLHTSQGLLVLGAVRDRTRQQRVEAEIKGLNQMLQTKVHDLDAANQEMEEFTYSTAHDLRAPVRHMQSYAEIVLRSAADRLNEDETQHLRRISASSTRLGHLIDGLLRFARLGRMSPSFHSIDLNALIAELRDGFQVANTERNIRWEIDRLPTVVGDADMLRLAFGNLLENAIKFTKHRTDPTIRISCDSSGDNHVISVQDNGAGFDPEFKSKLFHVFQRLHRDEEFEGTGIGLAKVRRVVERHGGRVWAEGERGRGATFFVLLAKEEHQGDSQRSKDNVSR